MTTTCKPQKFRFIHRAWTALASIFLALALAAPLAVGAGCTTLEMLDEESDKLLDKANSPGGSTSSSSYSSGKTTSRGLSVVKRDAMPKRIVKDSRGRQVIIWGQTSSSSTTPGHDKAMEAKAQAMALTGDYEYITLQRAWRTATGRVGTSRKIPDIIGVRRDGKVDAFEVKSKSDKQRQLQKRLDEGMRSLPAKHRGNTEIINP